MFWNVRLDRTTGGAMSNQVPAMQTVNALHIHATNPHMIPVPVTNVPRMQIQSPTAVKRRFSARNILFKTAMGCMLLCTVVFIVGFSVPAWNNTEGLWTSCYGGECDTLPMFTSFWFHAVRYMECLALSAFVGCLLEELRQDFRKVFPFPPENKIVEILAFLAGLLGLIGIIVFGVKSSTEYSNIGIFEIGYRRHEQYYLSWGFILVTVACSLSIVCAACIAYSRVKHAAQTNAALTSQSYVVLQTRTFQHPSIATGGATMAMYTQPSPVWNPQLAETQSEQP